MTAPRDPRTAPAPGDVVAGGVARRVTRTWVDEALTARVAWEVLGSELGQGGSSTLAQWQRTTAGWVVQHAVDDLFPANPPAAEPAGAPA